MKYNDCVKRNHYISNPRFQEKILYEQKLPGMDGFETMEGIRKESSLPILMLTAKNDISSRVRGLRAGADDYLAKSFDMDELIARIRRWMAALYGVEVDQQEYDEVVAVKALFLNEDYR